MTILVGLTGSIGMGKSTTAAMFSDLGIPVWDADAAVHRIYSKDGIAVGPISDVFPDAVVDDAVSREILKQIVQSDPTALKRLEQIVHPLVADDRAAFIEKHQDAEMVVLDIPLLFETGADQWLDHTICVSVNPMTQTDRVLARPGMTKAQFETIVARQMPDAEKRALADTVIETYTLEETRSAVREFVQRMRK